jgi:NAD(P)-dependent dehydrogenase (short-subunit alcohol dehydrogenase family)
MSEFHFHATQVTRGLPRIEYLQSLELSNSSFVGKKYLIVGENSPISKSLHKLIVELGAEVILGKHSSERIGKDDLRIDVRNVAVLKKASADLLNANVFLDGIINCAGVAETPLDLENVTDYSDFKHVIEVNLIGTYNLFSILLCNMKNNSSFIQLAGGGASGPMMYLPGYSSSKAGVVRLIETLSREFTPSRVRLNCLGPGAIRSNMTEQILQKQLPGKIKREIESTIPGRSGFFDPSLTAKVVCLLLTDQFSGVSGKFFSAQWDNWEDINELVKSATSCSDSFSLRRAMCVRIGEQNEQ